MTTATARNSAVNSIFAPYESKLAILYSERPNSAILERI